MDAVYILGTGSECENQEIKYSVRSLEQHMLDLRNVFVIGEKPDCLPNAVHVPMKDPTIDKWKNAYLKIIRACEVLEISEDFFLMNDDFFLLDSVLGAEFPFYALKGSNGGPCGLHSFHIHCPMRLNKEMYIKMPFSVDIKACKSPRSMYANFYKAPPSFTTDFILRVGKGMRDADEQVKGWPSFSISNSAMHYNDFLLWLAEKYPTPSRFE